MSSSRQKWSIAVDANGIPIGRVIAGANRNDSILLTPTLDAVAADGLLIDIETLHLDRGYDSHRTLARLADAGIVDAVIQKRGTKDPGVKKQPIRLGLRWIVEATNSWLSNYGQLRRNTDRRERHRHAALSLASYSMWPQLVWNGCQYSLAYEQLDGKAQGRVAYFSDTLPMP